MVDCKNDSKHEGLFLSVEATVNMQLSSKNVGLFEAFYNSARVRKTTCFDSLMFDNASSAYSTDQSVRRGGSKWQVSWWPNGDSF